MPKLTLDRRWLAKGVDEHAVKTDEQAAAMAQAKTKKVSSGKPKYVHGVNSATGKAMARANAKVTNQQWLLGLFENQGWGF